MVKEGRKSDSFGKKVVDKKTAVRWTQKPLAVCTNVYRRIHFINYHNGMIYNNYITIMILQLYCKVVPWLLRYDLRSPR